MQLEHMTPLHEEDLFSALGPDPSQILLGTKYSDTYYFYMKDNIFANLI